MRRRPHLGVPPPKKINEYTLFDDRTTYGTRAHTHTCTHLVADACCLLARPLRYCNMYSISASCLLHSCARYGAGAWPFQGVKAWRARQNTYVRRCVRRRASDQKLSHASAAATLFRHTLNERGEGKISIGEPTAVVGAERDLHLHVSGAQGAGCGVSQLCVVGRRRTRRRLRRLQEGRRLVGWSVGRTDKRALL